MVHLGNKAVLFLLCSCFFINSQNITQTSILFLLCAFIIGCLFSYWEGSKGGILFLTALVCLLMLCFPAFGFYLPVFIYDIIQAKDYFLLIPAGIGLIRFCPAFLSSAFRSAYDAVSNFIVCFWQNFGLQRKTAPYSGYQQRACHYDARTESGID